MIWRVAHGKVIAFQTNPIDIGTGQIGGSEDTVMRIFGDITTAALRHHIDQSLDQLLRSHFKLATLEDKVVYHIAKDADCILDVTTRQYLLQQSASARQILHRNINIVAHATGGIHMCFHRYRQANCYHPSLLAVRQLYRIKPHQRTPNRVVRRIHQRR